MTSSISVEDVLHRHERHLDVHLGELRLAVGAQVLVAEAAGDLVVALDAGDHEHLLEQLRATAAARRSRPCDMRLGTRKSRAPSGVDFVRIGRLDLEEPAGLERLAEALRERVAQHEVGEHLGAADVDVAVLQARELVDLDARRRSRTAA